MPFAPLLRMARAWLGAPSPDRRSSRRSSPGAGKRAPPSPRSAAATGRSCSAASPGTEDDEKTVARVEGYVRACTLFGRSARGGGPRSTRSASAQAPVPTTPFDPSIGSRGSVRRRASRSPSTGCARSPISCGSRPPRGTTSASQSAASRRGARHEATGGALRPARVVVSAIVKSAASSPSAGVARCASSCRTRTTRSAHCTHSGSSSRTACSPLRSRARRVHRRRAHQGRAEEAGAHRASRALRRRARDAHRPRALSAPRAARGHDAQGDPACARERGRARSRARRAWRRARRCPTWRTVLLEIHAATCLPASDAARRGFVERLAWTEAFTRAWERIAAEQRQGTDGAPVLPRRADLRSGARARARLHVHEGAARRDRGGRQGPRGAAPDAAAPPRRRRHRQDRGRARGCCAVRGGGLPGRPSSRRPACSPSSTSMRCGRSSARSGCASPSSRGRYAPPPREEARGGDPHRRRAGRDRHPRAARRGHLDPEARARRRRRAAAARRRAAALARAQRAMRPHLLTLSATPIPRTLALALRGELATSTLRERPAGRPPVATELAGASKLESVDRPRRARRARAASACSGSCRASRPIPTTTRTTIPLATRRRAARAASRARSRHEAQRDAPPRRHVRRRQARDDAGVPARRAPTCWWARPWWRSASTCPRRRSSSSRTRSASGSRSSISYAVASDEARGRASASCSTREPLEGLATARLDGADRAVDGRGGGARRSRAARGRGSRRHPAARRRGRAALSRRRRVTYPWLERIEADARAIAAPIRRSPTTEHRVLGSLVARFGHAIAVREEAG